MRVAHFISGDLWAGAEVMAYNLLRELSGYPGLDVYVYLLNEGVLADKLRELPVNLTVVAESQCSFAQLLILTRRWFKRYQPHIIHSHRYKENILAYLASRGSRRVRLVTTQHGLPEANSHRVLSPERLVAGLTRLLMRKRFDRVVGVSADIGEYFRRDCVIPAERLCVIHNGIDLSPFSSACTLTEPVVVGSAGRLFPVKDYPLMVEVARYVAHESSAIRFELAGDGPQRVGLERQISEQSLEKTFCLLGHLDDISPFYDKIHIYINTSVHEGIPMSILEAMAHGLPVVAPAVGGISEIIDDGIDGFLVDERSPAVFAEQILKLQDRELRRCMGEAAREKIRRSFSAQSMATRYYELYREIV